NLTIEPGNDMERFPIIKHYARPDLNGPIVELNVSRCGVLTREEYITEPIIRRRQYKSAQGRWCQLIQRLVSHVIKIGERLQMLVKYLVLEGRTGAVLFLRPMPDGIKAEWEAGTGVGIRIDR